MAYFYAYWSNVGAVASCWTSRTYLHSTWSVFYAIIDELHALGYTDSKFVTNNWPSFYIALLLAWQLGTLESDSKDLMILLHCKQFFILTAFS